MQAAETGVIKAVAEDIDKHIGISRTGGDVRKTVS
jgi:hypothetical protein